MSKRGIVIGGAALALSLAAGVALAGGAPEAFVKKAGVAGLYEVRAAELAQDKVQAGEVREFAVMMLDDHRKANEELRGLAKKKSWNMPAELDTKHQKLIERLTSLSGADFEREYAQQQLQGHEQAVALFKEESASGKDSDLKAWAGQKLPTLEKHLRHAQELQAVSGVTPSGSRPQDTSVPGDRL
jgi:putative membrane protein